MNGLFPKIECRAHWMVSKDIVTENLKEKIVNKKKTRSSWFKLPKILKVLPFENRHLLLD